MVKSNEAIRLAEHSDWTGLQRLIEKTPLLAREKDDYGMLPIHWASTERDVPITLLQRLIDAYPEGPSSKNNANLLPVHIAVRAKASMEWIQILLNAYPASIVKETPNGQTPSELAEQVHYDEKGIELLRQAENAFHNSTSDTPEEESSRTTKSSLDKVEKLEKLEKLDLLATTTTTTSSSSSSTSNNHLTGNNNFPSNTSNKQLNTTSSKRPMTTMTTMSNNNNTNSPPQHFLLSHSLRHTESLNEKKSGSKTSRISTHGRIHKLPVRHESLNEFENYNLPMDSSDEEDMDQNGKGHQLYRSGILEYQEQPRILSAPTWQYEESCHICKYTFGVFRHRHHCRNCGHSICREHCAGKYLLPNKPYATPQRTCTICYADIQNNMTKSTTTSFSPTFEKESGEDSTQSQSPSDTSLSVRSMSNSWETTPANGSNCMNTRNTTISRDEFSTIKLQKQIRELQEQNAEMQKTINSLVRARMTAQSQLLEQEEVQAKTMLLLTETMTRVSMLELHSEDKDI